MNLDENTFNLVMNLIKTKNYNSIAYVGCWSKDTTCFEITNKSENGSINSGFILTVNNDIDNLKIVSIRRLTKLSARNIYGGSKNSGYKKVWDKYNIPLVYLN